MKKLITWELPIELDNVESIVLYKRKGSFSCEDTILGEMIFETFDYESEFIEEVEDFETWSYGAFAKNSGGYSPCATKVSQVEEFFELKIIGENGVFSGSGTYERDTVVSIEALPDPGYDFLKWSSNEVEDRLQSSTKIKLDGNKTIQGFFIEQKYSLKVFSKNGESYRDRTIELPQTVDIQTIPIENYQFKKWYGDNITDLAQQFTSVFVDKDKSVEAESIPKEFELKILINNPDYGEVVGAGTYSPFDVVEVQAKSFDEDKYMFVRWDIVSYGKNEISGISLSSSSSYKISVKNNITLEAIFYKKFELIVFPDDETKGTTSSGGIYDIDNNIIEIEATALTGYDFERWEVVSGGEYLDNLNEEFSLDKIAIYGDVSIKAIFSKNVTITLIEDPATAPTRANAFFGAGTYRADHKYIEISASSNIGYYFDKWSVQGSFDQSPVRYLIKNKNLNYIKVLQDVTLVGHFDLKKYRVVLRGREYLCETDEIIEPEGSICNLSGAGSQYTIESDININVTEEENYRFLNWSVAAFENQYYNLNVNNKTNTIQIESDIVIDAILEKCFEVEFQYHTGETDFGQAQATSSSFGNNEYNICEEIIIQAIPETGYVFREWEIVSGNLTDFDLYSRLQTSKVIDSDVILKPKFEKIINLEIDYEDKDSLGGSASLDMYFDSNDDVLSIENINNYFYVREEAFPNELFLIRDKEVLTFRDDIAQKGKIVTLKIEPEAGYIFTEWEVLQGSSPLLTEWSDADAFDAGPTDLSAAVTPIIFEEDSKLLAHIYKIRTITFIIDNEFYEPNDPRKPSFTAIADSGVFTEITSEVDGDNKRKWVFNTISMSSNSFQISITHDWGLIFNGFQLTEGDIAKFDQAISGNLITITNLEDDIVYELDFEYKTYTLTVYDEDEVTPKIEQQYEAGSIADPFSSEFDLFDYWDFTHSENGGTGFDGIRSLLNYGDWPAKNIQVNATIVGDLLGTSFLRGINKVFNEDVYGISNDVEVTEACFIPDGSYHTEHDFDADNDTFTYIPTPVVFIRGDCEFKAYNYSTCNVNIEFTRQEIADIGNPPGYVHPHLKTASTSHKTEASYIFQNLSSEFLNFPADSNVQFRFGIVYDETSSGSTQQEEYTPSEVTIGDANYMFNGFYEDSTATTLVSDQKQFTKAINQDTTFYIDMVKYYTLTVKYGGLYDGIYHQDDKPDGTVDQLKVEVSEEDILVDATTINDNLGLINQVVHNLRIKLPVSGGFVPSSIATVLDFGPVFTFLGWDQIFGDIDLDDFGSVNPNITNMSSNSELQATVIFKLFDLEIQREGSLAPDDQAVDERKRVTIEDLTKLNFKESGGCGVLSQLLIETNKENVISIPSSTAGFIVPDSNLFEIYKELAGNWVKIDIGSVFDPQNDYIRLTPKLIEITTPPSWEFERPTKISAIYSEAQSSVSVDISASDARIITSNSISTGPDNTKENYIIDQQFKVSDASDVLTDYVRSEISLNESAQIIIPGGCIIKLHKIFTSATTNDVLAYDSQVDASANTNFYFSSWSGDFLDYMPAGFNRFCNNIEFTPPIEIPGDIKIFANYIYQAEGQGGETSETITIVSSSNPNYAEMRQANGLESANRGLVSVKMTAGHMSKSLISKSFTLDSFDFDLIFNNPSDMDLQMQRPKGILCITNCKQTPFDHQNGVTSKIGKFPLYDKRANAATYDLLPARTNPTEYENYSDINADYWQENFNDVEKYLSAGFHFTVDYRFSDEDFYLAMPQFNDIFENIEYFLGEDDSSAYFDFLDFSDLARIQDVSSDNLKSHLGNFEFIENQDLDNDNSVSHSINNEFIDFHNAPEQYPDGNFRICATNIFCNIYDNDKEIKRLKDVTLLDTTRTLVMSMFWSYRFTARENYFTEQPSIYFNSNLKNPVTINTVSSTTSTATATYHDYPQFLKSISDLDAVNEVGTATYLMGKQLNELKTKGASKKMIESVDLDSIIFEPVFSHQSERIVSSIPVPYKIRLFSTNLDAIHKTNIDFPMPIKQDFFAIEAKNYVVQPFSYKDEDFKTFGVECLIGSEKTKIATKNHGTFSFSTSKTAENAVVGQTGIPLVYFVKPDAAAKSRSIYTSEDYHAIFQVSYTYLTESTSDVGYLFNNVTGVNPTFTANIKDTLTLNNQNETRPMAIYDSADTEVASQDDEGKITFTPQNAGTYYYQCTNIGDEDFKGNIQIELGETEKILNRGLNYYNIGWGSEPIFKSVDYVSFVENLSYDNRRIDQLPVAPESIMNSFEFHEATYQSHTWIDRDLIRTDADHDVDENLKMINYNFELENRGTSDSQTNFWNKGMRNFYLSSDEITAKFKKIDKKYSHSSVSKADPSQLILRKLQDPPEKRLIYYTNIDSNDAVTIEIDGERSDGLPSRAGFVVSVAGKWNEVTGAVTQNNDRFPLSDIITVVIDPGFFLIKNSEYANEMEAPSVSGEDDDYYYHQEYIKKTGYVYIYKNGELIQTINDDTNDVVFNFGSCFLNGVGMKDNKSEYAELFAQDLADSTGVNTNNYKSVFENILEYSSKESVNLENMGPTGLYLDRCHNEVLSLKYEDGEYHSTIAWADVSRTKIHAWKLNESIWQYEKSDIQMYGDEVYLSEISQDQKLIITAEKVGNNISVIFYEYKEVDNEYVFKEEVIVQENSEDDNSFSDFSIYYPHMELRLNKDQDIFTLTSAVRRTTLFPSATSELGRYAKDAYIGEDITPGFRQEKIKGRWELFSTGWEKVSDSNVQIRPDIKQGQTFTTSTLTITITTSFPEYKENYTPNC